MASDLARQPESTSNQRKNKLNLIKIKNLCISKDTIKKMKIKSTVWEKIYANHISDKELVSRRYKELL